MLGFKLVSTPTNYCSRLNQKPGTPLSDTHASDYKRIFGRLIYLTNSRPRYHFCYIELESVCVSTTHYH